MTIGDTPNPWLRAYERYGTGYVDGRGALGGAPRRATNDDFADLFYNPLMDEQVVGVKTPEPPQHGPTKLDIADEGAQIVRPRVAKRQIDLE